jgi:alpha-glucosidase
MDPNVRPDAAQIKFTHTTASFSFNVSRFCTGEVVHDREPCAHLRAAIPAPKDYAPTYGEYLRPRRTHRAIPVGNHPVYFEHCPYGGTHGVFLLSSSGMDVKIRSDSTNATTLE